MTLLIKNNFASLNTQDLVDYNLAIRGMTTFIMPLSDYCDKNH